MATLRLVHRQEAAGHVVEIALEGSGLRRTATARFDFKLTAQDREDVRWYLEDYLQYPVEPAPQIARQVETRMAELGHELFTRVLEASQDTFALWQAVAEAKTDTRLEIATGAEGAVIPWELLREPSTGSVLSLSVGAFVRSKSASDGPTLLHQAAETLRVLLVICRPLGKADVPFRSVASHLVRLSRGAREAFRLDVLRPPTFSQLTQVLGEARAAGSPYQVVHFDGHGAYLDVGGEGFSLVSSPRPGPHGFLVFEDPLDAGNRQLVDGPALGQLLADMGVPVLVLNACRSAHADLVSAPQTADAEPDAHGRVRAYGSLAQEVMDYGVAGVVAMRYNVYVVTAAQFIGEVYAGLLAGRELGMAVTAARRKLAASPLRAVGLGERSLQDWIVPVVYEAAPLILSAATPTSTLKVGLSQAEAGRERTSLDPTLPDVPDSGFYGRDETLLALDRAFDAHAVVLLHAWAGAGKTSTALEFARWYVLTGATEAVLFTPFTQHVPLVRLLDQVGDRFGQDLARIGVQWSALNDAERRDWTLRILAEVPVLWVWDNVEPVTGFPEDTASAWTRAEQDDLSAFLLDLARHTKSKVLLTSRRDEQGWLGNLPRRVDLPPMPMLERLELARAVAAQQTSGHDRFLEVEDWRPLLEFTQGNPLTVTVLVRQALRDRRSTRHEIEEFVADLRSGAAMVSDYAAQGRDASLAASLGYGFGEAFTDAERAQLALLALFQGFANITALWLMGNPYRDAEPVQTVAGIDVNAGRALLDRAADVGLLTAYTVGSHLGCYAVHPAVPWYLHELFEEHYGAPDSEQARQVIQAWTVAIGSISGLHVDDYVTGDTGVIVNLRAEEANLLRACQLAREHHWPHLLGRPSQGLNVLYSHTGRAAEWRRLVADLVPEVTDPATDGPLPGCEEPWVRVTGYRAQIAQSARDWKAAERLQHTVISWYRERTAVALADPAALLDDQQRIDIRSLAIALAYLGDSLQLQQRDCLQPYLEAIRLHQRTGDRYSEGKVAFHLGNAYINVPSMRDLSEAERWYQRSLELTDEQDALDRARTIGQLGNLAHERFYDARDAGIGREQLARLFMDAVRAYLNVLDLLPSEAIDELAVTHHQLAIVFSDVRDISHALPHYHKAIQYRERQDNYHGAARIRFNAANALEDVGRDHDALLYARAALNDYEKVGQAAVAEADQVRKFIAAMNRRIG